MSGLPNFLRAMAISVRALENKNSMVLIFESLDRWKMHSGASGLPPYFNANMIAIRSFF